MACMDGRHGQSRSSNMFLITCCMLLAACVYVGIFAQSYTEAGSFPSTLNSGSEAAFGMSCPTPGSSGTCFAAVNRGLGGPFSVLQYDRVSGFAGNSWRGNIDFFRSVGGFRSYCMVDRSSECLESLRTARPSQ